MSAARTTARLLRFYPRSWRDRYGEELAQVIVESSGEHVPWQVCLDVVRAGCRERLRASGLSGDGAPHDQIRGGALLVLCAWALFVIAGFDDAEFPGRVRRARRRPHEALWPRARR